MLTMASARRSDALTAEWRTFAELRAATGQGVGVLDRALRNLAGHGLAEHHEVIGARDSKGRDVNSKWRLKGGAS